MKEKSKKREIVLVLDNIRSCHNVGSLFRTGDSFGVSKIILGGITPGPIDKYGRKRPDIAKVALGAEDTIPYEHAPELATFLKNTKQEASEIQIISLEQSENSISLFSFFDNTCTHEVGFVEVNSCLSLQYPLFLVVGNEVDGVSKEILELSDLVVEIPQMGEKESLNVSVAAGIALFALSVVIHNATLNS